MDRARPTLLLTRPEAQSRRFAAAFRARFGADWPVLISPLAEIRFLDPGPLPDEGGDLVFTSQNAVDAFARLTADRSATAWCVGERTAESARSAGFRVRVGPGDAAGLAAAITAAGGGRRLVYPRAVHVARDLAAALDPTGIETISVTVYDQVTQPPSPEAVALIGGAGAVLLPLFSPRSARIAASAFSGIRAPLLVAAMSEAVAEAAGGLPARRIAVAARPDAESMLGALGALIDRANTG